MLCFMLCSKCLKSTFLLYIKAHSYKMVAKHPETINFTDEEEYKLFLKAVEMYNLPKSEFMRRIISNWLFQNKLQIESYNGK